MNHKNKVFIISLLAVVALPFAIALFTTKEYRVAETIIIERSKEDVFNYIKFLKSQDEFSVWNMADDKMQKTYRGQDGTVGAIYAWDSELENIGKGEQEIKHIIEGERIDFELRFFKPFVSTDQAYVTTKSITKQSTELSWGFHGKMHYPANIVLWFQNIEAKIGKDLASSLINVKHILEKKKEK